VVPAVLLFGTARRVNPGQCVVKNTIRSARLPHEHSCDEAGRNAKRKEERSERDGEREWEEKRG